MSDVRDQPMAAAWPKPLPGRRPFLKMHGLRNHFVIVDGRGDPYRPDAAEIVRICDMEVGIGADQLVVMETANEADVFMRLYNVDGREVEACGNATRCVAWLLMQETGRDDVVVETLAGALPCVRAGDFEVSCDMGPISTDWRKVPLARECDTLHLDVDAGPLRDAVALNVGNPHAVFFVDAVDDVDLSSIAPSIQALPIFPDQVNVGIAEVVAPDRLRVRVYERGTGLTTACGSGACAAAYAALTRGLTAERDVTVTMPAGDVRVAITSDDRAIMSGPVARCFAGYL